MDLGDARRAADQNHLVDVAGLQLGVCEGLLTGGLGALNQVVNQALKLGARQGGLQVLRPRLIGGDKRQVDFGRSGGRQLDLGLFGRFFEPLQGHGVAAQVNALVLLKFLGEPVDDLLVEVVAAKVGVAVGGFDLKDPVAQFQNRNVKGAAAEVVHGDLLVGAALV